MNTDKIIKNTPANIAACACVNCPSYNDCARAKRELLFCSPAVGPGTCGYQMNGCLCGSCPIHREYGLKSGYYCLNK